jgi:hypothetical protein
MPFSVSVYVAVRRDHGLPLSDATDEDAVG